MKRVLLNAMASTAGGGTTYLRNVLPRLAGKSGKEIIPPDLFFIFWFHRNICRDTCNSPGLGSSLKLRRSAAEFSPAGGGSRLD
ncbi:MAG: hypothetical protein IPO77_06805 [Acidobacteria bacterium]|nr:hypothetical protein [Acidobacteriota bacterium]